MPVCGNEYIIVILIKRVFYDRFLSKGYSILRHPLEIGRYYMVNHTKGISKKMESKILTILNIFLFSYFKDGKKNKDR
jgi:hypothetical protein